MMNEFLENYEILGGKMKPVLAGETSVDKLETFRKALGEAKIRNVEDNDEDTDDKILMPVDLDEKEDRWDCETILCEYRTLPLYRPVRSHVLQLPTATLTTTPGSFAREPVGQLPKSS